MSRPSKIYLNVQLSCKGVWRNARIVNDKIGNDLLETQQAKVRRRKIKKLLILRVEIL